MPIPGSGVWKINNSLLEDEDFRALISELMDLFVSFRHAFPSSREFLDALENDIRSVSVSFSRDRSREKVLLTNRLIVLKRRFALGNISDTQEVALLEASLRAIFDKELEGSKIRSRARWMEEGEAPSRYFFTLEGQRHEKTLVPSVFDSAGVEVFSLPDVIRIHEEYYTDLFAEEEIDLSAQNELLSFVTARLPDAKHESCEGPLSLAEATEASRLSSRNKTPGPDGLSVEFYATFWSSLGPLLVSAFNECLAVGDLRESMKASVTHLVHKKDNTRLLKNWRPISLLNVEYKALSLRLAGVLDSIISPDQTGSVPSRTISSNLNLLRDCVDYIERTISRGHETGSTLSAVSIYGHRFSVFWLRSVWLASFANWLFVLFFGPCPKYLPGGNGIGPTLNCVHYAASGMSKQCRATVSPEGVQKHWLLCCATTFVGSPSC